MKKRKHIAFTGDVQGVGFRYRASHLAGLYGLTGWVENMWDGSVEMEVQGEAADIQSMMKKIREGQYIYVDRMMVKEMELEEENGFHIHYS